MTNPLKSWNFSSKVVTQSGSARRHAEWQEEIMRRAQEAQDASDFIKALIDRPSQPMLATQTRTEP
jgi:hypothetical protein